MRPWWSRRNASSMTTDAPDDGGDAIGMTNEGTDVTKGGRQLGSQVKSHGCRCVNGGNI